MDISYESVSDEYLVDWGERLGQGMNGSVRIVCVKFFSQETL